MWSASISDANPIRLLPSFPVQQLRESGRLIQSVDALHTTLIKKEVA